MSLPKTTQRKKRSTTRKTTKKSYPRRRRYGITRSLRPMTQNYASSVETLALADIESNIMTHYNVNLKAFPRSWEIASNYQWYRLKRLEFKYEPLWNVYGGTTQAVGGTPAVQAIDSMPQFYFMMNRNGNELAKTLAQLQQLGAKPFKFISNKTIAYKPNTLVQMVGTIPPGNQTNSITINAQNKLQFDAWLPTEEGSSATGDSGVSALIPYFGHDVYIEQEIDGNNNHADPIICKVSVIAHFEFKQPSIDRRVSPTDVRVNGFVVKE